MFIMLPELRPYLERLLEDALAQANMTIRREATRERILYLLQKEFVHFAFTQLMAALPAHEHGQFAFLLEQGASDETLQDFTMRHIADIPAFVAQVFQQFRACFVSSSMSSIHHQHR